MLVAAAPRAGEAVRRSREPNADECSEGSALVLVCAVAPTSALAVPVPDTVRELSRCTRTCV